MRSSCPRWLKGKARLSRNRRGFMLRHRCLLRTARKTIRCPGQRSRIYPRRDRGMAAISCKLDARGQVERLPVKTDHGVGQPAQIALPLDAKDLAVAREVAGAVRDKVSLRKRRGNGVVWRCNERPVATR